MKKNVVIVGGGSAGWLTALWSTKFLSKNYNITLVESDEIGILGAGEGSVPHIIQFLVDLGVDPINLISETDGSIKLGISFENWNGDGKNYFHDFTGEEAIGLPTNIDLPNFLYLLNGQEYNDYDYLLAKKCSINNKVPFEIRDDKVFALHSGFSMHFDAHKIAKYLRKVSEERNVKRIEGKISDFEVSEKGIEKILMEDGRKIDGDFFFDCSGFARLVIGKKFETPWVSYGKSLPMKRAIPFFPKPNEEHTIPYTRAIAMKYGWQWQIPLQHRFGAGYVFDSDFITPDQAKDELDQFMGYEVECPRVIEFNAGRFEKAWVKNCIAVGLSSGFIEPLEATAIWTACSTLDALTDYVPFLDNPSEQMLNRFNEAFALGNDDTLAFIYYHYITKRKDTEFWKNFTDNTVMPERLKEIIDDFDSGFINSHPLNKMPQNVITRFNKESWLQVGFGTGIINREIYKKYLDYYDIGNIIEPSMGDIKRNVDLSTDQFISHKDFLQQIKQLS